MGYLTSTYGQSVAGIADPLGAGLKATFEECVKSEQGVLEQLKREWANFSAADKQHCVALATRPISMMFA
jgi:hypothetical protein